MKRHALNCYSVLLKFLLKTKTCKYVVGNRVSFTSKTTNSEKSIYFLSLMSCSINKLKSHMLFTCKNFVFSDFTWKTNFAPGNDGEAGTFVYSPVLDFKKVIYHLYIFCISKLFCVPGYWCI